MYHSHPFKPYLSLILVQKKYTVSRSMIIHTVQILLLEEVSAKKIIKQQRLLVTYVFISIGVSLVQSQAFHDTHRGSTVIQCNTNQLSQSWVQRDKHQRTHMPWLILTFFFFLNKYMVCSGAYTGQESVSHSKNMLQAVSLKVCGLHNDNSQGSISGITMHFLSCILRNAC